MGLIADLPKDTKFKGFRPIAGRMDGKFAMVMVSASIAAFAATWSFEDQIRPIYRSTAYQTETGSKIFKNCDEVRAKGLAPLMAGRPGYSRELDPDGTGLACPPIK